MTGTSRAWPCHVAWPARSERQLRCTSSTCPSMLDRSRSSSASASPPGRLVAARRAAITTSSAKAAVGQAHTPSGSNARVGASVRSLGGSSGLARAWEHAVVAPGPVSFPGPAAAPTA
jgi:hypothetical protein